MKKGIHPVYRPVLYVDNATGDEWRGYTTIRTSETRNVDGEDLGVIKLDISAASHPFWTGKARSIDAEGRIDRFKRRYGK